MDSNLFHLQIAVMKNLILAIVALTLLPFFSCKKNSGDATPITSTAAITFFNHSDDSRLFRVVIDSENIVDYSGLRGLDGFPAATLQIALYDAHETQNATYLNFSATNNKLDEIFLGDGSSITISWLNDTTASLIASAVSGAQLNTVTNATGRFINKFYRGKGTNPRANQPLRITAPIRSNDQSVHNKAMDNVVKINVTKCGGIPSDAENVAVWMWSRPGSEDKLEGSFPATKIATGLYSVTLPSGTTSDYVVTPKKLCEAGIELLDALAEKKPLSVVQKMVRSIILYEGENKLDPDIYTVLKKADKYFTLLEAATDKLEFLKKEPCQYLDADYSIVNYGGVRFVVEARSGSGNEKSVYAPAVEAPAEGHYPDLSLELGSRPSIETISLVPQNPVPYESYIATAYLDCFPLGSTVSIGVEGTDGYVNSLQIVVTADMKGAHFPVSLLVPGASTAGIRDLVTVQAKVPGDNIPSRIAQLVFGG